MIKEKRGISDISSSEGKLSDFTKICKIIESNHSLPKKKIFQEFNKSTESKSYGSFERKITIMEKLGLIETVNDKCTLDSFGKIVTKTIRRDDGHMETLDKILYFIILFSSLARRQLSELLEVISLQQGLNKKEIMIKYFTTPVALELWDDKKRVKKNLESLEQTDILPSMLNNKLSCMKSWLEYIDLIEIKNGKFYLKIPKTTVNSLLNESRIKNIYEDASSTYYNNAKKYNDVEHYNTLRKLVITAHNIFCIRGSGTSDLQAVSKFICLKLLEMKIILEEERLFELIRKLIEDKTIRSVMVGRDGTLKNLVL